MGANNTIAYMEIRHRLMDMIVTGNGTPLKIPTSRKLAEQFGCTHPTVLRALRDLVAEKQLLPCKRGGYITTHPGDMPHGMKIFGVVIQEGKSDFDTAFFETLYHSVAGRILARSYSYCVRNIYLEAPSRLGAAIMENSLSGLILIAPIPAIIQEAKKEEKKGLPVVALYKKTDVLASCDLGAENVYEKALELLVGEKRRNLLLVGSDHYYYLSDIEKMLSRFKKEHPDTRITFLNKSLDENFQTFSDIVYQGETFDGVIFLRYNGKIYDFLQNRFDTTEQCRLVIDQFGIFEDMDFTGWVIQFDLAAAARFLVDALLGKAESPKEHRDFEFDFAFCSNGILEKTVSVKQ